VLAKHTTHTYTHTRTQHTARFIRHGALVFSIDFQVNKFIHPVYHICAVGSEPNLQLRAFGAAARAAYISRGKVPQMSVPGSGHVEEMTSVLVEKAKRKIQRIEEMERLRTANIVMQTIATRDMAHDLQVF
jgi:hypothetical protein